MPERKERLWPNNFPSHPTQNFILGHRVGYWKPFNPATASLLIHSLPSPSILYSSMLSYYLFSSHSHFPFCSIIYLTLYLRLSLVLFRSFLFTSNVFCSLLFSTVLNTHLYLFPSVLCSFSVPVLCYSLKFLAFLFVLFVL